MIEIYHTTGELVRDNYERAVFLVINGGETGIVGVFTDECGGFVEIDPEVSDVPGDAVLMGKIGS